MDLRPVAHRTDTAQQAQRGQLVEFTIHRYETLFEVRLRKRMDPGFCISAWARCSEDSGAQQQSHDESASAPDWTKAMPGKARPWWRMPRAEEWIVFHKTPGHWAD